MVEAGQSSLRDRVAARVRSRAGLTYLPLLGYAVFTLLWIGRGVALHPTTRVLGNADRDKALLMWSFSWWPHAIAHGLDPFVSKVVWAPHGVDLAWVTSSPTLSLLLTPFTETLGPVFSYNLAALAAPPLAAWTTYLLARRITRNVPGSLIAGFLFGFSPYVISQSITHLNLSFVCLVPLAGLLAVRFFDGDLGRWRYAALLALVLTAQFGISTEIFATFTVFAAICLALAVWLLDARPQLAALARYTALGYLATAVVVSPYLVHAFLRSTAIVRRLSTIHSLDLANVFFPTETTWLRPPRDVSLVFVTSGLPELGGYIGIPLFLLVLYAVQIHATARVRRGIWLLAFAALIAEAFALGTTVTLANHPGPPGVWAALRHLPALGEAIPIRFVMYTALCLALIAALWLAQPGPRLWRFVLAGAAVVSFLPTPSSAFWTANAHQPPFFATSIYRQYIHPGDRALVFPYAWGQSWSMLWQAETGFRFSMIGGHVGQVIIPAECQWAGAWGSLSGGLPRGGQAQFRRFILAHHVTVIIEAPHTESWSRRLIHASLPDVRAVHVAKVKIFRIPSDLPVALPPNSPYLPPHKPKLGIVRAICGK